MEHGTYGTFKRSEDKSRGSKIIAIDIFDNDELDEKTWEQSLRSKDIPGMNIEIFKSHLISDLVIHKALSGSKGIPLLYDTKLTRVKKGLELEIVMESFEGTLYSVMDKLSLDNIEHAIFLILESLKSIHDLGIIHADVKPTNIVLNMKGEEIEKLAIIDFGISIIAHNQKKESNIPLHYTFSYRSPNAQKIISNNKYQYYDDLWAVGVIFSDIMRFQLRENPYCEKKDNEKEVWKCTNYIRNETEYLSILKKYAEKKNFDAERYWRWKELLLSLFSSRNTCLDILKLQIFWKHHYDYRYYDHRYDHILAKSNIPFVKGDFKGDIKENKNREIWLETYLSSHSLSPIIASEIFNRTSFKDMTIGELFNLHEFIKKGGHVYVPSPYAILDDLMMKENRMGCEDDIPRDKLFSSRPHTVAENAILSMIR